MTKKKGVIAKLFAVLVVLTLLSCCFLGSTFARYTSGGTGSATTGVAKWDIDVTDGFVEDADAVDFKKLSPAQEAYTSEVRTNTTGKIKVAEMTNNGDVDAEVTFTFGDTDETFAYVNSTTPTWGTNGIPTEDTPREQQVKDLFSIKLYYGTTGTAEGAATVITSGTAVDLAKGATIYIYAEVIWTTADEALNSADNGGADADKLDTWVGENVSFVTYGISYVAVQDSELPGSGS